MDLAHRYLHAASRRAATCVRSPTSARPAAGVVPLDPTRPAVPFPATTRWLRGRILAALTTAPTGVWVPLPERLGQHDAGAIDAAARGLEREGFLDLRAGEARVRERVSPRPRSG